MTQPILSLPAISAADLEYIQNTFARALDQDELMKKLDKELNSPEQPSTAVNLSQPVGETSEEEGIGTFLEASGIINIELGPPGDYISFAPEDIHPIFRLENFTSGLPDDVMRKGWAAMAPAFALATKWITTRTPALQGFWHRLIYGEPTTTVDGKIYLAHSPLEDDFPAACARFEEILMGMANKTKFWWAPEEFPDGRDVAGIQTGDIFQFIAQFDKFKAAEIAERSGYRCGDPYEYDVGYIGISCVYLYDLLSVESSSRSNACAMMRLQIEIAYVLCHELSHAVYSARNLPNPEIHVFPSDAMAEVGFSWSVNVLGADMTSGSSTYYLSCKTYRYLYSFPGLVYVNNDRWAEAWFRKDTWARIDEVMGNDLLKLPNNASLSGPVYWIADRLVGESFLPVVYMNREAVWPEAAVGQVDSPPEGVSLEEWFAEVRKREKELAIADGFDEDIFMEAKGGYVLRGS